MTLIDDARAALSAATFILVGYGDGRGTETVRGYDALRTRVLKDCGVDIDEEGTHDEWQWSDEKTSLPYSLDLAFEAERLLILRLSDRTVTNIADCADYKVRVEEMMAALRNIRAAVLAADPDVISDTLWMPDDICKGATVVDYIDQTLAAPIPSPTDAPASDTRGLAADKFFNELHKLNPKEWEISVARYVPELAAVSETECKLADAALSDKGRSDQ